MVGENVGEDSRGGVIWQGGRQDQAQHSEENNLRGGEEVGILCQSVRALTLLIMTAAGLVAGSELLRNYQLHIRLWGYIAR